jgi:hypothetical protein
MDPISVVQPDAMPTIVTIVAPGAFVTAPIIWAGVQKADGLKDFLGHHEAVAFAGVIVIWILAGNLVQSLGSYVEVYAIDRRRPNREEELVTWWQLMRTVWTVEPVGVRYLRRTLVMFKFELNTAVASLLNIPLLLALRHQLPSGTPVWRPSFALLVMSGVLFALARDSAGVLAETRKQLMRGVGRPPFDAQGNPSAEPCR